MAFKDGIIAFVEQDVYLKQLDNMMDGITEKYKLRLDFLERRYQKILRKPEKTLVDKRTLAWIDSKNKEILDVYTQEMLEITNKLADHMEKKQLLPKDFNRKYHYIGITTKGAVYITSKITQKRIRNIL